MKIKICETDIHLLNLHTRMPFKYGIATMTQMPMAFVRARIEVAGRQSLGVAADLLPPKWFTKDPARSIDDEVREMLMVIERAARFAVGIEGETPFQLWRELYEAQMFWGSEEGLAPLLANFGTSLVERAVLEAFSRALGKPFYRLLLSDQLGIELDDIHPALTGRTPADLLPPSPRNQIMARHTVGLSDPLLETDILPAEVLHDGLPQSLAACIQQYGLRHFKIKVGGNLEADLDRLTRVAGVIQQFAADDFAFTLDGNEQFKSLDSFRALWESLSRDPKMQPFLGHLLFFEQPLHRNDALKPEVGDCLRDWAAHPPMIIDESDATLDSLPTALKLGYSGTSHKNCKGVFKGIINRCLLLSMEKSTPNRNPTIMSGEDLCNIGPIALQQDLAVCAALGIASVERNGHHYNSGLSQFPTSIQEQVLKSHGDLYRRSEAGWPTLNIKDGSISLSSVNEAPFGVRFLLDSSQFTPSQTWHPVPGS
jgi:L-alanine-DL-glutamate epimerase-like enolase superfamily enzyme